MNTIRSRYTLDHNDIIFKLSPRQYAVIIVTIKLTNKMVPVLHKRYD